MSTKYTTSHQLDSERPDYTTWSHEALLARKRELTARLLEHYPMPATETDEDAHIGRVLQQHKHLFRSAAPTAATSTDENAPATDGNNSNDGIDGNELIHDVTQFIARYLQCSEHQRTLLALWVLHTYCFCAARVTPYLAIRSADKQSGKTLCLQLLSLLCDRAALTSGGFTARDLAVPMKEKTIDALLFDECHLTVHPRSSQVPGPARCARRQLSSRPRPPQHCRRTQRLPPQSLRQQRSTTRRTSRPLHPHNPRTPARTSVHIVHSVHIVQSVHRNPRALRPSPRRRPDQAPLRPP